MAISHLAIQCEDYLGDLTDDLDGDEIVIDKKGLEKDLDKIESAFLSADTAQINGVLSQTAKIVNKELLSLCSKENLTAYGEAFKNRKESAVTSHFAEYEFEVGGIKYTVSLSKKGDNWFLTRF